VDNLLCEDDDAWLVEQPRTMQTAHQSESEPLTVFVEHTLRVGVVGGGSSSQFADPRTRAVVSEHVAQTVRLALDSIAQGEDEDFVTESCRSQVIDEDFVSESFRSQVIVEENRRTTSHSCLFTLTDNDMLGISISPCSSGSTISINSLPVDFDDKASDCTTNDSDLTDADMEEDLTQSSDAESCDGNGTDISAQLYRDEPDLESGHVVGPTKRLPCYGQPREETFKPSSKLDERGTVIGMHPHSPAAERPSRISAGTSWRHLSSSELCQRSSSTVETTAGTGRQSLCMANESESEFPSKEASKVQKLFVARTTRVEGGKPPPAQDTTTQEKQGQLPTNTAMLKDQKTISSETANGLHRTSATKATSGVAPKDQQTEKAVGAQSRLSTATPSTLREALIASFGFFKPKCPLQSSTETNGTVDARARDASAEQQKQRTQISKKPHRKETRVCDKTNNARNPCLDVKGKEEDKESAQQGVYRGFIKSMAKNSNFNAQKVLPPRVSAFYGVC
jgi:hypothetical protein